MAYIDFLTSVHRSTKRDYLARVNDAEYPKARAAELAKQWGVDYWDGDRRTGYGGYRYDGRWRSVARAIADHYKLQSGQRVLDIGCGKGFLLYDLAQEVPGLNVVGIDISQYGLEHSHPPIQDRLQLGDATNLDFPDKSFDLSISITTLHNLPCYDLSKALREITRVSKRQYICVESYRNESEKANLLYWQLTCEMFCSPAEWEWWFGQTEYTGDHSFIYFE